MNGGICLSPSEVLRNQFIQSVPLARPRQRMSHDKDYPVVIVFSAPEGFISLASLAPRQAGHQSLITSVFILKATSSF